jgi:hypothetical protein
MLIDAQKSRFHIVIAESLDRLSRDQEDIAAVFKLLQFHRIELITLSEGVISELHVGLKGTMNALFLKDLAAKTRRGLYGRVKAGRSPGGISFGYRMTREFDTRGEPIRGGREIDPAEAAVIHRIFEMFAAGRSPRGIARELNREDIPGPGGRKWRDTTIRGHAARGTGILRNELYIGRLVWNRQSFVRDPRTGKRLSRPNSKDHWVIEEVPKLLIVAQDLWNKAAARLHDQLDGLVTAIAGGLRATSLQKRLNELEAEKEALTFKLREPESNIVDLQPNLAALYRRKVGYSSKRLGFSRTPGRSTGRLEKSC